MKYLIRFNESVKEEKYFLSEVDKDKDKYDCITESDLKDKWNLTEKSDKGITLLDYIEDAEIGDRWILNTINITRIRKFSPNMSYENIKKISEEYLIYLTDIGFTLDILKPMFRFGSTNPIYSIELYKENSEEFNWEEIKYDFIPFIEFISEKYIIDDISLYLGNPYMSKMHISLPFSGGRSVSVNDILDDKSSMRFIKDIKSIKIRVR
jgi:hypothetical protein